MRCRRIIDWTDSEGTKHRDVVWFGSVGVFKDSGTAVLVSESTLCSDSLLCGNNDELAGKAIRADGDYTTEFVSHYNYAEEQEGVVSSLTQRLSVLKGELWYRVSYGIPLLDKTKSGDVIDSFVMSTVLEHPNVRSIKSFTSAVSGSSYSCDFVAATTFGDLSMSV